MSEVKRPRPASSNEINGPLDWATLDDASFKEQEKAFRAKLRELGESHTWLIR